MSKAPIKLFFDFGRTVRLQKDIYIKYAYNILNRFRWSEASSDGGRCFEGDLASHGSAIEKIEEDSSNYNKWKPEIAWLGRALEPALQLYKWALPSGNGVANKLPPTDRSISEIFSSIQRSKLGFQDWTLSDLTIGLYLLYLRQASSSAVDHVNGEIITSESIVHDLIYHLELAKGSYRDNAGGLARNSMLREKDVIKFTRNSSLLRPGYYIGIDRRKKLVILCIRGTQNVYDLITDVISSGHEGINFETSYSTHYGTAEAARWFLTHEMGTIRRILARHEGFRLRLVGHSLGGAIASLLAVMLRKKSPEELGFSPDIVSAIGFATPPCVSKELAENCADSVSTVVMQDDVIPRLSPASITRLRNEIVETDWISVFTKEDWRGVIDVVANARQAVASLQDVARKLADYAKFRGQTEYYSERERAVPSSAESEEGSGGLRRKVPEDLYVPGSVYYLKRNAEYVEGQQGKCVEYFTLLKRRPGEHFYRIILSSNLISDHKCDAHYYALRDVIKGL